MPDRITVGGLSVAEPLYRFVVDEALGESGIDPADFWTSVEALFTRFAPINRELVARRGSLQRAIDDRLSPLSQLTPAEQLSLLTEIGYLEPEPEPFVIATQGIDTEITEAGPQLVVPLLNARFAVNAANARWGSLYDALYGSDAIDDLDGRGRGETYNPLRGVEVIARGRAYLDESRSPQPGYDGAAFVAARMLILYGLDQPSGYTEPILHTYRRRLKEGQS